MSGGCVGIVAEDHAVRAPISKNPGSKKPRFVVLSFSMVNFISTSSSLRLAKLACPKSIEVDPVRHSFCVPRHGKRGSGKRK
jgi:hypothetical protein